MTKADKYLLDDIKYVLENGYKDVDPRPVYEDGTPAYTISVNHMVRKYDLSKGEFPICTLRPQAWKTGIREIFAIYQKCTNVLSEMEELGVTWWGPWDIGDGTIGQRYGATVKRYDLINNLIKDIKENPYGRRKIVSLWQESDLRETPGLPPCAFLTMWNVRGAEQCGNSGAEQCGNSGAELLCTARGNEYLDMSLIQRSGDMMAASGAGGINEIQYAALLMMIARVTGKEPGVFTHFVANEQIYDRHIENAKVLLERGAQLKEEDPVPMLVLNREPGCAFEDFTIEDFEMKDYSPMKPQLKFDLGI